MPSTGPSMARRAVGEDDQDAESLGELLDDRRPHHRAEDLGRVGVRIAEDERQSEIDKERDRDRGDGPPGERECHQPPGLRLPAIDEPDGEENAGERDEREDGTEEGGAGADELEEVADECDEQQDEYAADPDGRASSRATRRHRLQRHRGDGRGDRRGGRQARLLCQRGGESARFADGVLVISVGPRESHAHSLGTGRPCSVEGCASPT